MKYDVLTYGRPELRRPAVRVEEITDEIRQLARDLLSTLYARNGLGLAAAQVGRPESLCVLDVRPRRRFRPCRSF